ncbi:hypothetical protein [Streptomyces sp. NPDC057686]|uniref:hypothetical protein n=1 Tax=Streptomyces sp. NPDC057686 TaxID=3346212 RepID=UPI0036770C9A
MIGVTPFLLPVPLGAGYLAKRDPERAMRRITKEANSLELTVCFKPTTLVG